jgi:hypothetical protein
MDSRIVICKKGLFTLTKIFPFHEYGLGSMLNNLSLRLDCAFLGIREDGLPLWLDFANPASGSVLIIGDTNSGKTHLLRTIMESALFINGADQLRYEIITNRLNEWRTRYSTSKFFLSITVWETDAIAQVLSNLVSEVKQRLDNAQEGTITLLILDDLAQAKKLGEKTQDALAWLIYYGPKARIWPIASLNANQAFQVNDWLDLFGTRLIGKVASANIASELAVFPNPKTEDLVSGIEFCVWKERKWNKFKIPSVG